MKKFTVTIFLTLTLTLSSVFFCGQATRAETALPVVVINEIAWMGSASSSNNEWLELANTTDNDLSLEGWQLKAQDGQPKITLQGSISAHNFFLLERTDDNSVLDILADQIYAGTLGNSGEYLELFDANNLLVDSLDATKGWPAGDNATKATLERTNTLVWASSLEAGGTPRATNSVADLLVVVAPPVETASNTEVVVLPVGSNSTTPVNSTPINLPVTVSVNPGEVVLNELVSDPLDGEVEWVELYSNSAKNFDLSGWTLEDGSKARTLLKGALTAQARFLVITSPKGALNNTGDAVVLRDNKGVIIDQLIYGDWQGGQFNAPVARDGRSLARRFDGVTTFNSQNDWVVTETPTKGVSNIITTSDKEIVTAKTSSLKNISITEILPDPVGDDRLGEFIELHNEGEEAESLAGWRLQLKSGQVWRFGATSTINAHEYKVLWRSVTNLALPNDSGSIKLLPPGSDKASQSLSYKNGKVGQSYIAQPEGWQWTESPTPGALNRLSLVNQPPVVEFYVSSPVEVDSEVGFDSSDTIDPEGAVLDFSWDFGDRATSSEPSPVHKYAKAGNYHVKLTVSDGSNKTSQEQLIKVAPKSLSLVGSTNNQVAKSKNSSLLINELMPNPTGPDETGEWIELYNPTNEAVDMLGFTLDDGVNGSSPFRVEESFIVPAHDFAVFERSETDIALNNNADEVRLFNANGQLLDRTSYVKAPEGESWARTATGDFVWTLVPTPNEANVIKAQSVKLKAKSVGKTTVKKTVQSGDVGDAVSIKCSVTALPGVLGAQYFYCQNDRGWEIYNYKKDLPLVELGDWLEVAGTVQRTSGNWRLKIKDRTAIKKIGQKILTPQVLSLEAVSDVEAGKLIKVKAEVSKKTGSNLYLDDGTGEGLVALKRGSGLLASNYNEAEELEVTGILQNSQSGLKLLPRSKGDIKRVGQKVETYGTVATSSGEWLAVPQRTAGYVMVIGSGLFVLLVLLGLKKMGVRF